MMPRSLINKFFNKSIRMLPKQYLEEIFYRVGIILGVHSFTCDGDLGLFEGSINDDVVHRYYLRHGTWATGLHYLLSNIFANAPGTFIDVGANIGLIAIPIAKKNNKIDIYVFEPEYNNYNFLCKNILTNALESKIKTFQVALFSEDCTLEMEISKDNMGDHRVRRRSLSNSQVNYYGEESRTTVNIQARKLDSILNVKDLVKPIILKVDTQGAEVQVLLGAKKLLEEIEYVIVEYWPYGLQRMGDTTEAFFDVIGQFPWGAVYDDAMPSIPKLLPITHCIAQIDALIAKTGVQFLDILLSRHPL